MKKLALVDRKMAARLRDVEESRLPKEKKELKDALNLYMGKPDVGPLEMLCDRCMPDATPILTEQVWIIEFFKMVVCQKCADDIMRGEDALMEKYFDLAELLAHIYFTEEEIKRCQSGLTSDFKVVIFGKEEPIVNLFTAMNTIVIAREEKERMKEWRTLETL
jgi:hypothetical protein